MLDLVVTRLKLGGYQTSIARDGFRALDAIYASKPQGVVLDIGMQSLDGFGVLAALFGALTPASPVSKTRLY